MSFNGFRTSGLRDLLVWISATLLMSLASSANATGISQIVHERKAHFRTLGRTDKFLRDQMDRSHLNWNMIQLDTRQIAMLANSLINWFPAGSGKGHGVSTRASREIWTKPAAFAQAAQRLQISAQSLTRDATNHDFHALALDTRRLGQSCASCHRAFRTHNNWW